MQKKMLINEEFKSDKIKEVPAEYQYYIELL